MRLTAALFMSSVLLSSAVGPVLAQSVIDNLPPVTKEMLANPPAGDWVSYGHNTLNWRYSELDQINVDNAKGLQLVWARALDPGVVQSNALELNGVIFIPNPGDVIQAVNAVTGDLIWEYRRELPDRSTLQALGERKRGIALYEDKVIFSSWDNFIVALDAKTGQLAWETDRGGGTDLIMSATGPVIADGVVVTGSSCQFSEFACYVTGHDANTGEELWRNELIPRPGQEGDETWGASSFDQRWMTGVWGQLTYDPVLDMVYYGSSGAGPASEVQRNTVGGSLAGTNTRWAVKPKTGEVVWKHQVLPRDNWDQECTFEMIVTNTDIKPAADMDGKLAINPNASGENRRVLTGVPCKTGIFWQFDAATGEFIYARSTNIQDIIASIDDTGLVAINEDRILDEIGVPSPMCPTYLGGRDWPPTSYNPKSNVMFVPMNNMCADVTARDQEPTGLDVYNVDLAYHLPEGKTNIGRIDAIDVGTGKTLWSYEQPETLYAPSTATAGNLLFIGEGGGRDFHAIDQTTGEVVWKTRLASQVTGHPITYEVDGRQYVAVTAGGPFIVGDPWAAVTTVPVDAPSGSNAIYVFALPAAN
ncbi:MAG: PQQ-binding-like beta-propeller repeat protein [Devosia sp.]|nr:PQQ-binding-like beta-propeller repeat protein [Devosia sp.]